MPKEDPAAIVAVGAAVGYRTRVNTAGRLTTGGRTMITGVVPDSMAGVNSPRSLRGGST